MAPGLRRDRAVTPPKELEFAGGSRSPPRRGPGAPKPSDPSTLPDCENDRATSPSPPPAPPPTTTPGALTPQVPLVRPNHRLPPPTAPELPTHESVPPRPPRSPFPHGGCLLPETPSHNPARRRGGRNGR